MTLPDKATSANYGMPPTGFANANPIVNPATDWDAGKASPMIVDVAGMTRTRQTCWARFTTGTATTPATALVSAQSWDGVWMENATAATNTPPVPTRSALGVFVVTFPPIVTDIFAVTHALNFQRAGVFVEGSALFFAQYAFTANTITVYVNGTGFSATDAIVGGVGTVLHVWAC